MTTQPTLQCLSVNYPKPITAKLLNSQSQAWEMILSLHGMHRPITEYNAANTSYMRACSSSEGDGRRVQTSLVH